MADELTYSSFDDLVAAPIGEAGQDFTLPSGARVRVRGLSRAELLFVGKDDPDSDVSERRMIARCLVQPKLTEAQAEAWQKASPAGGDIRALTEIIRDLSGLGQGAQKSALDEDGD